MIDIDNMISEEDIEKYYTTREVLSPEYQEYLDQYTPSIEQPSVIDFDNELIPF